MKNVENRAGNTICNDFIPTNNTFWAAWRLPVRWSDGCLSEGYGHGGPGVCLGDGQTEAYLKDMGMTGQASAWAMARRRPKEYDRREVDAATDT